MIKLFRHLKEYRIVIVCVVLFYLMQALLDLSLPTLMANIVNIGIVKSDIGYIIKTGGIMISVAAVGVLCAFIAGFLSSRIVLGFSRKLRTMIFTRIESFSLYEFDKIGAASLITRTTNDVIQVQQSLGMMLSIMIRAPLMCIGGIIMAVSRDARLSLIVAAAVPALIACIIAVQRRAIPLFIALQNKLDTLNLVIREKLAGSREIRAFDRIEYEKRRFDKANRDLNATALRLVKLMSFMMPMVMTIMNFSVIAIVWFGGLRMEAGTMRIGDIMAFIQYVMLILFSLMMASMVFIMVPRAQVSAVRINEVLGLEPELKDPPVTKETTALKGRVEFRNCSFTYHGAERPALNDISFSAKPGEVTAIIGGTGSGKSTLVNLLPRFYDVQTGSVLIDGIDVREMRQEELRAKIGYVPQKSMLFTGTVSENIRIGNEAAGDEQIRHAADAAQASEFVPALEKGYDTVLAQGGKNFSGGQKQRLSIARALVKKAEVYIFDEKLSVLPLKFFDSRTHGEIMSRMTNDVDNINNVLQQGLPQLISSIIGILGAVIMMLAISPLLTLITIGTLPISFLVTVVIAKNSQRFFIAQQRALGELNGHVEEMLTGHGIIKAFNSEKKSIAKFEEINARLYRAGWKAQFISGFIFPLMNFINNIGYVAVCVAGGIIFLRHKIAIGDVQAFIQYIRMFTQPVAQSASIVNTLQSAVASAERVFEILDETEQSPDVAGAKTLIKPRGAVKFAKVKFGYTSNAPLFDNLDFEVQPGHAIAVVGPTSAGKTSLVNLLMRFYEIEDGAISVDGVDIRDLRRGNLRRLFGMVLQDAWLFSGSIRDNIAYGKEGASHEEIVDAAIAAHADHFIRTLPHGYDTLLNEDASNISMGEKQLITIARAILADPAMLILDEATSSVDTRTELLVQNALKDLMRDRTSFVIAHRLSTIREAELILVMNKGKIVEKGNHWSLLAGGGFYSELYKAQFAGAVAS